ncbi:MAG: hypothetical protein HC918_07600 [Oscillatoriales cyanobacterium SM2_1_8]|nr:hypothetical protein [Oscillatoriales cyanobacterium SM2_1_8]
MLADAGSFALQTVPCFPMGSATIALAENGESTIQAWSPVPQPWRPDTGAVAPQAIDLYSRTGEPGWLSRESLAATRAAVMRCTQ